MEDVAAALGRKPPRGALARPGRLDFPIPWRRGRRQRIEELARYGGDGLDRGLERGLVGLRRLVEAAHLAHELKRGGTDLVLGHGRRKIEEGPDVSAHGKGLVVAGLMDF